MSGAESQIGLKRFISTPADKRDISIRSVILMLR